MFRHGETDWNKEGRAQGQTVHVPLNETGLCQAEKLAELLANVGLEVVYTSPLKRAHQTALTVSGSLEVPLHLHDGLMERYYGVLEGYKWEEMIEKFPEHRDDILIGKDKTHPDFKQMKAGGAESLLELEDRIYKNIYEIVEGSDCQIIGISTHGTAIYSLLVRLLGRFDFAPIENCETIKLAYCPKLKKFELIQRNYMG